MAEQQLEQIEGTVEDITYETTDNGYMVFEVSGGGVLVDDVLHGALDLFQLLLCHALTSCQITQS